MKRNFFFDSSGVYNYSVDNFSNFKVCVKSHPHWIQEAVIYHIFVDRFYGIDFICKVASEDQFDFAMGDLLGIRDKVDYLVDLGVNTLCLTPIFSSITNHRYDVEDYFEVDRKLGGNEAFYLLMEECKKNGIKVILDGVFNHVSSNSRIFLDGFVEKREPFLSFFCISDSPRKYECFWDVALLPKLNYQSSQLQEYIFSGDDSVVKTWLRPPFDIDGIRIDACTMIGSYADINLQKHVLSGIYESSKSEKSACYILGENPFDPTALTPFVHYDGITNYSGFYTPLIKWICTREIETLEFVGHLNRFKSLLGLEFLLKSQNFIGNHDKPRYFSATGNSLKLYKASLIVLFFYPGVPTIYYGDEYGLTDSSVENDSRVCMKWSGYLKHEIQIKEYVKRLIAIRNRFRLLHHGDVLFNYFDSEIMIFTRLFNEQYICVLASRSSCPEVDIQFDFSFILNFFGHSIFSEKFDQMVEISIAGKTCLIQGVLEHGVLLFSNREFIL